ncbi:MAG: serine/threonine-protein kinase, partial [Myxococcota bacterium]
MILTQHTQAPAASFETACRRYRAGRLLKTAPDSSTYEGSRVRTRVPVTLKVMNSEGGRHRAVRMAEILASIRHPNLDILVDVTENPDGRPVVVLDARQGITLELLRQTYRRLPALRAVHIARQVLDGLDAIHQTGHLHAMIRPASVLVDSAPGFEDHVTLIDIGAQQISTDPRYAAPEVVQGLVPDPSSDIYSVGAILYELLSGAPPDINAPCSLKQKIPTCPRLATLVDSALAARPEDRPQTASELSYQLQQLDLATLARANWSEDVTQPNVSWIDPAASQIASFGARQPLWATQRPSIWVLT